MPGLLDRLCAANHFRQDTLYATQLLPNVDSRPSEKRISEFARPFSTPSASTTCEGSNDPAEQAEPLEAQMPSKSRPASRGMLSEPATTKATVLARRRWREPTNWTPGSRSMSGIRLLSQRRQLVPVENRGADKAFQGLHEANNACQVLCPGPTLVLMAAAEQDRGSAARATSRRALRAPLGPWILWAQMDTRSALNWWTSSNGSLPNHWTASV